MVHALHYGFGFERREKSTALGHGWIRTLDQSVTSQWLTYVPPDPFDCAKYYKGELMNVERSSQASLSYFLSFSST